MSEKNVRAQRMGRADRRSAVCTSCCFLCYSFFQTRTNRLKLALYYSENTITIHLLEEKNAQDMQLKRKFRTFKGFSKSYDS